MEIVLHPRRLHAVKQNFCGNVHLHGVDHVLVMEPHRTKIVVAHHDTARRACVENLSLVELLAAVACSDLFDHRTLSRAHD